MIVEIQMAHISITKFASKNWSEQVFFLVFEGPVHGTGKKLEPKQTEPWSGLFYGCGCPHLVQGWLQFDILYIYFELTKVGSNWLQPQLVSQQVLIYYISYVFYIK